MWLTSTKKGRQVANSESKEDRCWVGEICVSVQRERERGREGDDWREIL